MMQVCGNYFRCDYDLGFIVCFFWFIVPFAMDLFGDVGEEA